MQTNIHVQTLLTGSHSHGKPRPYYHAAMLDPLQPLYQNRRDIRAG
ncbi:hypothetical protein O9992_23760 [Vibrio lentus]|nr:hypothetical protein [Vibrio lentus]